MERCWLAQSASASESRAGHAATSEASAKPPKDRPDAVQVRESTTSVHARDAMLDKLSSDVDRRAHYIIERMQHHSMDQAISFLCAEVSR